MNTLPQPGTHRPVMTAEIVAALAPRDGEIFVDGTFGGGGHSRALLEAAFCRVWGIDQDPDAVPRAETLARQFPGRFALVPGRFGAMDDLLKARGVDAVAGIALDLGVSSMQIDDPERGFSFRFDGPLDMRMAGGGSPSDFGGDGPSAADLVNTLSEGELADIIRRYGEERRAGAVARAIVAARAQGPITRTAQLADIVRAVVRRSPDGIDPATRTFQALRIAVNDEIDELRRGLEAAERLLSPGGRLAVLSFHSLEDSAVKDFLRTGSGGGGTSRHLPLPPDRGPPAFTLPSRKAIKPGAAEIASNPRARSARLRIAHRTPGAPA